MYNCTDTIFPSSPLFRSQAVPWLRVRICVSGARTFVLRKRVAGKPRNITLGRYSERFGLADARKKARALLSDFEHGADPVAALPQPKKRNATALTVRDRKSTRLNSSH